MMYHKDLALVPYFLLFKNNMPIITFKNDKLVLYANDTSLVNYRSNSVEFFT